MLTTSNRAPGDAQLVRRCRARLRALLPTLPRDLDELCVAASLILGEPVELVIGDPVGRPLPSAAWLQMADRSSVVWVDCRTSPMMRTVAACHEFGHMISGHRPVSVAAMAAQQMVQFRASLAEDSRLEDAAITAIVGRCGESVTPGSADWVREREAEVTGRILAAQLLQQQHGLAYLLRGL